MPKVTDITERIGARNAAQAELDDFREFAAEPESLDFMERQRKARVKAAILDAPRQKSSDRFDYMDERGGQRQDPSRSGGRRILDLSEETVDRMAANPPWESRSFGTAGSSQQFDWFDKAEPFERYSITQEAYKAAGVSPPDAPRAISTDPSTNLRVGMTADELAGREKMVAARNAILAADPRSVAELKIAAKPAMGAYGTPPFVPVAAAAPPPGTLSRMADTVGSIARPVGRVLGKVAVPLAGAGALLAAREARAEGAGWGETASKAINEFLPTDAIMGANQVLLNEMARRRGFPAGGDGSI